MARVGKHKGCTCARLQNLAQVHHGLNAVEPDRWTRVPASGAS
jgi:hypothetical protein